MSLKLAGKPVGKTGYGLMGLTWRAEPPSTEQAFEAMKAALNNGANFWNGGDFYGPPDANSLVLLNKYFTKYPEDADKVVISIKGGIKPDTHAPDGSEEGIKRTIESSLSQLGGKAKLDIFEMARVDRSTPIEDTMSYFDKYIKAGKLGGVSLSEVSAATIRRAAKVQKIECVEVEFSLFTPDIIENGVAAACAENNIPIVAYSPLGRGFLTGAIKTKEDIPPNLAPFPSFQPGNFEKNVELANLVQEYATKKGCTPAQVAIAWVKAHSGKPGFPTIIPIPGATTAERINENCKDVPISDAEVKELDSIIKSKGGRAGNRYPDAVESMNWG